MSRVISLLCGGMRQCLVLLLALMCLNVYAADCPISPTQYYNVSIPDPDPPPAAGEWPADLSQLMGYLNANNITTVKGLLSHMPLHMRKHYSFVRETGALNVVSLQNPGLLPWGSDSRFMMNIGTTEGSPLYEVADIAYLQDDGDWEFRALDFRGSTPVLSPHGGGNGGECRECHGLGSTGGVGPLRPFLGNYLFWTGFMSDSGGAEGEAVTADEKPVFDAIKNGQHNMDRFHSLLFGDFYYAVVGTSNMLPDHAYGPGLTIFNTEMAAAVTESLHKRMSRSPNYRGLREEMLALSYCDGKQLSSTSKNAIMNLVESKGGAPRSFISYNSWAGVYQAVGLDPMHELPLHILAKDRASATQSDMNWNTGVSHLRESVDLLILMELAQENSQIAAILANNQTSYNMTGGCGFSNLKQHFDHKIYALYTLHGNARQKARESYYDIDYHRVHQSMGNITGQLCSLLSSNIGPGTIGTAASPGNLISVRTGGAGNYLAGGPASSGNGMSLYVFDNDQGSSGSACNGSCASLWPPLIVNSPAEVTAPSGTGNFSTITRNDGSLQVTFNGRPVYFYASDGVAGDVNGHGVGNVWWLAQTSTGGGNVSPVADANGPYSGTAGSNIAFSSSGSNDPDGTIASYSWNFGDSSNSSSANPSHSYASAGTYSVTLTVTDNQGASASDNTTVTVTGGGSNNALTNGVAKTGLSASTGQYLKYYIDVPSGATNLVFQISGGSGDADMYTRFGAEPTDSTYNCRPYKNGNSETCTHANPSAGRWYVNLKAYSSFSNVALVASFSGGSNQAPVADANGPYSGTVGSNISFSSAGSSDPDGSIASYSWNFGDGSSSSSANPSHSYSSAGSYTVTLTVTDNQGATGSDTASVTVNAPQNTPPVADANGPYTGTVGNNVAFSSAGSNDPNGSIASYSWNFGDGSSSSAANPSHSYSSAGTYTVTLTVTDNQGATDSDTTTATITAVNTGNALSNGVAKTGLSASTGQYLKYYIDVPSGATNLVFQISGGSGDADMYTRFGAEPTDSTYTCRPYRSGNSETCTHANPSAGRWYVNLKAYSSFSNVTLIASFSGSSSNQVPVAEANGPYSNTVGNNIPFSSSGSNDPDGSIASYSWNFGDGSTSNAQNPAHAYSTAGTYTVTLTVTDNQGATDSDTATVTVTAGTTALGNGTPITGLSGATGSEKAFFIHVHGDAPSDLNISISGGSGDADMYVRQGAMPTTSTYDCRPYKNGNSETCTFASPQHGPYYIMLRGYSAYSGVTLSGSYDEGNSNTQNLVMVHNDAQHGNYLAGGPASSQPGLSLYVFDNDQGSSGSTCNGSCASTWPPLTVSSPSDIVAPPGSGNLGTITRNDGSLQVTLEGRPLYFYVNDNAAGDTNGHGVGGTWWLASLGTAAANEYGLANACALGRPAMSNMNISLGQAICTQNRTSGQVNFKYTPTASDVGKAILFTIGHGSGIAGLTANQDFNAYATEADYNANPNIVYGSFGFDPLNQRRTYNFVIVPNVQAGKDIWISLNAGSGGFSGVALKGEVIVPPNLANLPNACAAGSPPISDQYVTLGQAVCGRSSQGPGFYTHFIYRPTAAEAGKSFLLEMGHGTGNAFMTVNQHYSSAPTSGGTAFAHEEHLSDRPDLVYASFVPGVKQRVIYPNATANRDILVVIPPGPTGFSNFTFRISVLP